MVDTRGFDPQTGEWNDTLTGDFVWSNINIGEALSCVVTPFTWSVIGTAYDQMSVLPGYHSAGNVGGRAYQNGTVMVSALQALGRDMDAMFQEMAGSEELPVGLTVPVLPITWRDRASILFNGVRLQFRQRAALREVSRFVGGTPRWCQDVRQRIASMDSIADLAGFWAELQEHVTEAFWCAVSTVWRYAETTAPLRRELAALVGDADTNALLSGISTKGELLASLGPVVGLSRVARGEMTREAYLQRYGHRGPYEAEFAVPRPAEDPAWLDRQLDLLSGEVASAEEMLARQRAEFEVAWRRFQRRYAERAESVGRRLTAAAHASRQREAVRSELTRLIWVGRAWALRAGELTGLGDDIFYLISPEVLDLLAGKPALVETIPSRRATDTRYRSLPPYPPIISGRFDPFAWAADLNRRTDLFDSHVPELQVARRRESAQAIRGVPGSAGLVEGVVRRIDSPEQGGELLPGEILVTSQTNVGWTILFPRASAVVTDVGAPLSHAAIVARELGIPAVVGCGDATARLGTGDRVRVDGARGTVEVVHRAVE